MIYRWLADGVLLLHLVFILFVVLGGFAAWRWRWLAWLHLPAVGWGMFIEISGGICPLTPLENFLRRLGGTAGYGGSFIEHYLLGLIYPDPLTRPMQAVVVLAVALINLAAYARLWFRSGPPRE